MDLRESTGLPIVSEETALKYSENEISVKGIQIIKTEDVSSFLLNTEWKGKDKEKEVYRIYHGIRKV